MAALRAGKHVLVEKPLAATYARGPALVEEAERRGLTLMCDHTYCYTPGGDSASASCCAPASWASCSTSTRCGSTSGWCSATST